MLEHFGKKRTKIDECIVQLEQLSQEMTTLTNNLTNTSHDLQQKCRKQVEPLLQSSHKITSIEGPTYACYLKGTAVDGIERKFLLLGDVHVHNQGCENVEKTSLADFFRYLAHQNQKSIDFFIEEDFPEIEERNRSPVAANGSYLDDLQKAFAPCLKYNKEICNEPFRIHYCDIRRNTNYISIYSTMTLQAYKKELSINSSRSDIRWPTLDQIDQVVECNMQNARIDRNKIAKNMHPEMLKKFDKYVLEPVKETLKKFYLNPKNQTQFLNIQQALKTYKQNVSMRNFFVFDQRVQKFGLLADASLLDAYFLTRVFKIVSDREPQRKSLALQSEESMTRITCYFGAGHVRQIKTILQQLGFELQFEWNADYQTNWFDNLIQCLPYSAIAKYVDDFCI